MGSVGSVGLMYQLEEVYMCITKVIGSLEHFTVLNKREERNHVVVCFVTLMNLLIHRVLRICVPLKPLLQYAVDHCMMVDEYGIARSCCHISHDTFLCRKQIIV